MIKSDLKAEKRETHVANYHYPGVRLLSPAPLFQLLPSELSKPVDTTRHSLFLLLKKGNVGSKRGKKWDRVSHIAWYQPVLKVWAANLCTELFNFRKLEN